MLIRRLQFFTELGKEDERRFVLGLGLITGSACVCSLSFDALPFQKGPTESFVSKEYKLGLVRSFSVPLSPEGDYEILFLHTGVGKPRALEAVLLNVNGSSMGMVKSLKHFCSSSNF